MSKVKKSYRLKKGDIEYLQKLVSSSSLPTETAVLTEIINYYRLEQGLQIKTNQSTLKFIEAAYNSLIPFTFGALFAYFFIAQRFIFLPFLVLALFPLFFRIEAKDNNTLKVGI